MNIGEIIMISIGLSFDVFAVTVCEGAMIAKIEKKKLAVISVIFCLWQLVAVLLGSLFTIIPFFGHSSDQLQFVWNAVSVVIFFSLAVYMIYKAKKKEVIFEKLSDIHYRDVFFIALITSLDAFFAGMGFGLLNTGLLAIVCILGLITILAVVLGIYTGYRMGFEQKPRAYGVGGAILLIAGVEVMIRYLIMRINI